MKLWVGGTMKNMLYGGHSFELTIFSYDIWSRNHMKDMHKKCLICQVEKMALKANKKNGKN